MNKTALTFQQLKLIEQTQLRKSLFLNGIGKTGKTTVLKHSVESLSKQNLKGLFLSSNKSKVADFERDCADLIECKTFHGLAFKHTPLPLRLKLQNKRRSLKELAEYLQLEYSIAACSSDHMSLVKHISYYRFKRLKESGSTRKLTPVQKMKIIEDSVIAFCNSSDSTFSEKHLVLPDWMDVSNNISILIELKNLAEKYWNELISENDLNISHDVYLKYWALKSPIISGYDYIVIDDCHLTTQVINHVISRQNLFKIYSGDLASCSDELVNFFHHLKLPTYELNQLFGVGQNVANFVNLLINYSGGKSLQIGDQSSSSKIFLHHNEQVDVDAVICQTSIGCFFELYQYSITHPTKELLFQGNYFEVKNWLDGAKQLVTTNTTNHSELMYFNGWDDLCEYVELGKATEHLELLYLLITHLDFNFDVLYELLEKSVKQRNHIDICFLTENRIQNRVWKNIKLGSDFNLKLMSDKFSGVDQKLLKKAVGQTASNDLYLEDWDQVEFPKELKLIPTEQEDDIFALIPSDKKHDPRLSDQLYRISDLKKSDLKKFIPSLLCAEKNIYANSFAEFFILMLKLKTNLD